MKRGQRSTKRQSTTPRSRLTRADMAALEQLDQIVELQRRRDALVQQMPPGIKTTQETRTNGMVIYRFTHETLGELGFLVLAPVPYMLPAGICQVSAEMASADPDADEHWDEKYTLFKQVTTLCISALPSSHTVSSPLPELADARMQCQLYLRFLNCEHSIAMFGLAKSLSEAEYHVLLTAISNAPAPASLADHRGIEQRKQELKFYWDDLQARPDVEG